MLQYELPIQKREKQSRHFLRTARANNLIPCIAYGHNENNRMFSITETDLVKLIHTIGRENALINLNLDGDAFSVIIKDVARNPRTNKIIHIDFQIIHADEKIKVEVPIKLNGTAPGIKEGGMLEQILREIEIKCLPAKIPSHYDVDISKLSIGHSIHVRDIKLEDAELVTHGEEVIVTILAPRTQEEETTKAPEEESKEPEVITERKKEDEEPAAETKKKK